MKNYILATETESGLKALPFGPFTLAQAEYWQAEMAKAGKPVLIVNSKSI